MMYGVLLLGVLLWAYSHSMKRVTPGFRTSLGEARGKSLAAVLALAGLLLMIWGYRQSGVIHVWHPPAKFRHLTDLLMVFAVILISMQANNGVMRTWFRNPMLLAVIIWAVAHLLINGDVASLILFGGMLIWAVGDLIAIDRMEPDWVRPEKGHWSRDILHLGIAAVLFILIIGTHTALGYPPLG